MITILKPDFAFSDERGTLTQLCHSGYAQINVLTCNAGTIRGNHYHKHTREAFFVVSGAVQLTTPTQKLTFNAGDFFEIPQETMHELAFAENSVLVAMYDKCIENENGEKDIFT